MCLFFMSFKQLIIFAYNRIIWYIMILNLFNTKCSYVWNLYISLILSFLKFNFTITQFITIHINIHMICQWFTPTHWDYKAGKWILEVIFFVIIVNLNQCYSLFKLGLIKSGSNTNKNWVVADSCDICEDLYNYLAMWYHNIKLSSNYNNCEKFCYLVFTGIQNL